jgi:mono/diheme cytochrome c family protein
MTILIIAAAFIAIAILIVLAAMRVGPRKGPEPSGGNAGFVIVMVAITAFGLGVPAYAIVNNADTSPDEAVGGVELTAGEAEGRELFRQNCATCHVLEDAAATGAVGPSLDELQPAPELTLNAIELGRARGQGQMPAGLLAGEDAENVANYIAAVAGR